jgi:hypothetical protein
MFIRAVRRPTVRSFAAFMFASSLAGGAMLVAQDVRSKGAAPPTTASNTAADPMDEPLRLAYAAQEQLRSIRDYTCTFLKRERIGGELRPMEFIQMKSRTRPFSVYFKWVQPFDGREVIYVSGKYDNKLVVHSTGVEKLVGGTVAMDPRDERALENSRHDITESGLGNLTDRLVTRWETEKKLGRTSVELRDNAKVDGRVCWCVKTVHPNDPRRYSYYRTRVFFDKEHNLPIRFEAYDWPRRGSTTDGELVEEYTYRDLRFNQNLTAMEFSIENPKYNFGRL